MKNYLLGVFTILTIGLFSFNTIDELVTIKPAKPKEVFAGLVHNNDVQNTIYHYTRKGFQVKSASNGGYSHDTVLVMEKY